ncbi:MAG: recombination mediator RecR [Deltaproteobacteria bacterium]|jgi:recombination protein RecR|nr:recombination mediator RecR [Deltaproteobacteria bacterium]
MKHPPQIEELVERLSKLPGLGRKSATRLALHLLRSPEDEVSALAAALMAVKERIRFCSVCHDYTDQDPCPRCSDPKRDRGSICVVESPADLMVIEASGIYHGLYHVLGGVLNPLAGIGPDELNIQDLVARVDALAKTDSQVRELILATGSSPEAEATCSYIVTQLGGRDLRVTRLARGLPSGMDLEFVDGQTLRQALEFRGEAR